MEMRTIVGLGIVLFAPIFGCGPPDASMGPDCLISIDKISAEDPATHTITADGAFGDGQPILVLADASGKKTIIPGDVSKDNAHATFDVSGLAPGIYKVSFDASCNKGQPLISDNASPTVQIL